MQDPTQQRKVDVTKKAGSKMPNPKGSEATVCVACKLPLGMHLDVRVGGKREIIKWADGTPRAIISGGVQRRVTVIGSAIPRGLDLDLSNPPRVVGDYGITPNVPKDVWDAWMSQYKDGTAVRSQLVFAMPKQSDCEAKARELAGVKTPFAPVTAEPAQGVQPEKGAAA